MKKNKKKITIKSFTCSLISLISCISLCFVCLFPVKKIYAEGEAGTLQTGKNILTLLLGQMGVELVGAAATIDQYVQEGWQLFLNGLSSPITPEAYTLTAIAGMVQWDDVNNVLSVPKDLYNLVSQWALDLSNAYDVKSDSYYENLGQVYVPSSVSFLAKTTNDTISKNDLNIIGTTFPSNYGSYDWYAAALNNLDISYAVYDYNSESYYGIVFAIPEAAYNNFVSLNTNFVATNRGDNVGNRDATYQKKNKFTKYSDFYYYCELESSFQIPISKYTGTVYDSLVEAVATLTAGSVDLLDNVYVNGNLNLDDRIISTDNGAQLELDPVLEQGITYSLDDVLSAVMDWVTTNTWPDMTTVFVDALPIALDEPIDTVLIPTAPYVEVPQILLPSNLPIIYNPECESLSACLVAGISAVSNDITSFYNSNESIRNYANIILFVGVSFVALGVIRRHL